MLQYTLSYMDIDNKIQNTFSSYIVFILIMCLYYFSLCSSMSDIKRNVHKTQSWGSQRSGKIPREPQRPKRHGF